MVPNKNTRASNDKQLSHVAREGSAPTVAEQGRIANQDEHDELGSEPESYPRDVALRVEDATEDGLGCLGSDDDATVRGNYDIEDEDIGLPSSNGGINGSVHSGEEEQSFGSKGDVTLGSEDTLTTKDKDAEEELLGDKEDQLSTDFELEEDGLASESDSAAEDNNNKF
ncbi:hypothetical protein VP01_1589g2 [Puccinia sorghi]|uniref:Uncharacterized protein n=1 Tax=Puccinia sorghi TaxID=27349 RepID=A0A0L6VI45_9BASI|nr:hypothetical protein VP01_1589g2 [Puccinia sorghi]